MSIYGSSSERIIESATSKALRTANSKLFPASATRVRPGAAINDIIALNAGTPGRYTTPPFKGGGRFIGGDPRAKVTGLARTEELARKRKAKSPVPGSITSAPPRVPIAGPKSKEVSWVDDLFGKSDAPLRYTDLRGK